MEKELYLLVHKYDIPTCYFRALASYPFPKGSCLCVRDKTLAKKFNSIKEAEEMLTNIRNKDDYIIKSYLEEKMSFLETIKREIIQSGHNIGCVSNEVESLDANEKLKVLRAVKFGLFPLVIDIKGNKICEVEEAYYNDEIDITIKHKDYYN